MKKCPTCEKTFDDNLKFCQSDGTPLVTVEEAEPEDPYKTTVAKQDDLPIPPADPYQTMVAGSTPPPEEKTPSPPAEDVEEPKKEEEIDPLKTIVSNDFPPFEREAAPKEASPVKEEPKADTPPPSPFSQPPRTPPPGEPKITGAEDISATPPDPPKFSEPDLNPPTFGDQSQKPAKPPTAPQKSEPSGAAQPPKQEEPPKREEPPKKEEPPKDFGQPPFRQPENAPIPSPFEESQSSGYQPPLTPMPPYKEAEIEEKKAEALNTPFAEQVQESQQMEPQGWNPPPAPEAGWQNQEIGQNTPFQPPPTGGQGTDQTLAIVSLACGILSIPCCGFFTGIPAVILGFMAKSKAENNPEQFTGRGLALGGIITGGIGTVLSIILFILQLLLGRFAQF